MSKKRLYITVLVSLLAVSGLLLGNIPAANAQGQTSGLTMDARAAFDGYFKYGEWLPLWVQLENSGPDMRGEVQVRVTGRGGTSVFAAPVDMPTGSRKLVPLYALPNNFSHALEVQYVSGNTTVVKQNVTVRAQPNINYMVGIASPERGALSQLITVNLPGMARKVVPIDIFLADLPERPEGLRSFDALIINELDTSALSPQQKSALETWVRQGGRLIIGGGSGLIQTVSGFGAAMLPGLPRGFEEVNELSGLSTYVGGEEVRVQGPFVAATLSEVNGNVLASQGNSLPLVVEKGLGNGFIDLVALDLSSSPFNAWAGTVSFWEQLISPNAAYSEWLPPDMSARQMAGNQMIYALSNLPALDLPSIRGLALLLGIYIVLVGPVNYLLLRWRKRLHWAWVTIPLITLIFSAGAFSLGYIMRGNDLLLNRVIVAELQPGGTAYTRSYYGLFSPSQSSYQIEVSGGGLLSQLTPDYDPWGAMPGGGGEVVFVQGEPSILRGLAVNQWSMQSFTTEGIWDEVGQVKAEVILEGSKLTGNLTNETGLLLHNTVLILGSQIIRLGELPPGESRPIEMDIPDLMGQVFGPPLSYRIFEEEFNQPRPGGIPRELQLKQQIIDSLMPYGGGFSAISSKFGGASSGQAGQLLLLGWFDAPADEVRVAGRAPAAQTTALLYGHIPYSISTSGHAFVPPGLISGSLVEMPFEGGTCGPGGTLSVYLGRGEAVFEFRLPQEYSNIEIENLLVQIGTEGGWMRIPEVSFYNWDSENWIVLDTPQAGSNRVSFQEEMVSSNKLARVKLASSDGFASGCYYLGLGLEGRP